MIKVVTSVVFFLFILILFSPSVLANCSDAQLSQGDANCDDTTDITDFDIWRTEYLNQGSGTTSDFDGNGTVDLADFEIWRQNLSDAELREWVSSLLYLNDQGRLGIGTQNPEGPFHVRENEGTSRSLMEFTGTGNSTLFISDFVSFTHNEPVTYTITVNSEDPTRFDWTDGTNSGENIAMARDIELSHGVIISFPSDEGYTAGSSWTFTAYPYREVFKTDDDGRVAIGGQIFDRRAALNVAGRIALYSEILFKSKQVVFYKPDAPDTSYHFRTGTGGDYTTLFAIRNNGGIYMPAFAAVGTAPTSGVKMLIRASGTSTDDSIRVVSSRGGNPLFTVRNDGEIYASGNMGIGTDTPQETLDVNGGIKIGDTSNNGNGTLRWNGSNLQVYNGGWQSITTSSDKRLKENIEELTESMEKLNKLDAITYSWKDKTKNDDKKHIGLLAQQVMKVFPEAVYKNAEGYYNIRYEEIIPALIAAVQDKDKEIEDLKKQVSEQQDKIDEQQIQIEKHQNQINKINAKIEDLSKK